MANREAYSHHDQGTLNSNQYPSPNRRLGNLLSLFGPAHLWLAQSPSMQVESSTRPEPLNLPVRPSLHGALSDSSTTAKSDSWKTTRRHPK